MPSASRRPLVPLPTAPRLTSSPSPPAYPRVVYLEQAYKRPKYLLAGTFAATTVILSFSSSNCIVFATYVFSAAGIKGTEWQQKGLACAAYTFAIACILVSTKWSLRLSNVLAMVKIVLLVFIAITGLVVLGGKTRVQNPTANFHNAFAGTTSNGNAVSTALTKVRCSPADAVRVLRALADHPPPPPPPLISPLRSSSPTLATLIRPTS